MIRSFAVASLPDTTTTGSNPMLLLVGLLTLMALAGLLALGLWRRRSTTDGDRPA